MQWFFFTETSMLILCEIAFGLPRKNLGQGEKTVWHLPTLFKLNFCLHCNLRLGFGLPILFDGSKNPNIFKKVLDLEHSSLGIMFYVLLLYLRAKKG